MRDCSQRPEGSISGNAPARLKSGANTKSNMNISQLKESKFLKKEDCGQGILVTINRVEELNIAKEGAPQEFKWCIFFDELEKPMVLNSTNGQIIAQIAGSEESGPWTGHKVVLYHEPSVSYGGKVTGGIRVRAPRNQPARAAPAPAPAPAKPMTQPRPAPAPAPADEGDSGVPF